MPRWQGVSQRTKRVSCLRCFCRVVGHALWLISHSINASMDRVAGAAHCCHPNRLCRVAVASAQDGTSNLVSLLLTEHKMKMSDIEIFDHLAELVDFFVVPLITEGNLDEDEDDDG